MIGVEALAMKLQNWEKKWWWRKGQFHDLKETPGILIGITGWGRASISAGGVFDERLPRFGSAPPGRYRACFTYIPPGKTGFQDVYSEEFSLP
jgi:hypothetical protein